jgi:hypothetical protein
MLAEMEHSNAERYARRCVGDLQINDLRCGSSILRFGRSRKLLISSYLWAGSSGWTRTSNPPVNSQTPGDRPPATTDDEGDDRQ